MTDAQARERCRLLVAATDRDSVLAWARSLHDHAAVPIQLCLEGAAAFLGVANWNTLSKRFPSASITVIVIENTYSIEPAAQGLTPAIP